MEIIKENDLNNETDEPRGSYGYKGRCQCQDWREQVDDDGNGGGILTGKCKMKRKYNRRKSSLTLASMKNGIKWLRIDKKITK